METLAIIDFETTGLSPNEGARATEIAAIILQGGRIVRRYQSLMNAGVRVPFFITDLTGITNRMVRNAPSAAKVMREVADFVGDYPLVAHNASFDRKFWDAELALVRRTRQQEFACTMLASRRVYPTAPNHKLGTLATFAHLPNTGKVHRAMADAELTAHLLNHMETTLAKQFQMSHISHPLLRALQRTKVSKVKSCIEKFKKSPAIPTALPTTTSRNALPKKHDGFSHRLRMWRQINNLTQPGAAAKIGISQSYWSVLENGRSRPSPKLAEQFQQLLGDTMSPE